MTAQKTPFSRTLNKFATQVALNQIEKTGRSLPGHVVSVSGAIVIVNFDVTGATLPQVTMPLFGPEYIRYPIQEGDKGFALPGDAYLGAISGLGTGVADNQYQRGNLSTLVWFPIGNKNWSEVDPKAVTLYGPNGVVLQDTAAQTTSTLTPDGISDSAKDTYEITAGTSITLTVGSHSIVIDSSGITIDGVDFLTHFHTLVETGADDSGPVGP